MKGNVRKWDWEFCSNLLTCMQLLSNLKVRFAKVCEIYYLKIVYLLQSIMYKSGVDVPKLNEIYNGLVITLSLLEKYFPPSFFDIMIHLTMHLIRKVQPCDPILFRWMYLFERYTKVFKGHVWKGNLLVFRNFFDILKILQVSNMFLLHTGWRFYP